LADALRYAARYPAKVSVQTAPSGAAVAVATLRAHVAQGLTDDDTMLSAIELAAQAWVEAYLGRAVLTQTREASYDGTPGAVVILPEPVNAISTVTTYNDRDVPTSITDTTYQLDSASVPPRLVLRDGQFWPTSLRDVDTVVVRYTCGWSANALPYAIRQAIQVLVAHWYEHREPAVVPTGVEALLMPYRIRTGVA
jgi:uncharacterized phiE125 gp8 family phage protein